MLPAPPGRVPRAQGPAGLQALVMRSFVRNASPRSNLHWTYATIHKEDQIKMKGNKLQGWVDFEQSIYELAATFPFSSESLFLILLSILKHHRSFVLQFFATPWAGLG